MLVFLGLECVPIGLVLFTLRRNPHQSNDHIVGEYGPGDVSPDYDGPGLGIISLIRLDAQFYRSSTGLDVCSSFESGFGRRRLDSHDNGAASSAFYIGGCSPMIFWISSASLLFRSIIFVTNLIEYA